MKKTVTSPIMLMLLMSMLTLAFGVQTASAYLPVHNKNTGLDYGTIQEAIDAPETLNGHTILVDAGTYSGYEYVNVYKRVSLVGENRKTTVIDGMGIWVTADNVTITNFTIRNRGHAPNAIDSMGENTTITNNILTNNDVNLMIHGSNSMITDNVIANGSWGVYLQGKSTDVTRNIGMSNNLVANNTNGIMLEGVHNCRLRNNTLNENLFSISVGATGTVGEWMLSQFIHDVDTSNTVNGKPIYYWVNQHNKQVPEDAGWVVIVNSTDITMKNLEITRNYEGINLQFTKNSIIEDVRVSNCRVGIMVGLYSCDNMIIQSKIENNDQGLYLDWQTTRNSIHHNSFINNTKQVYTSRSYPNIWDDGYPSGGNYWSGYTDVDLYSGPSQDQPGSDNIWDHPYVIDSNNQDHYPFVNKWSAADVNHDGVVDVLDAAAISAHWHPGPPIGSLGFDSNFDINGDGSIDVLDAALVSAYWTGPPKGPSAP